MDEGWNVLLSLQEVQKQEEVSFQQIFLEQFLDVLDEEDELDWVLDL